MTLEQFWELIDLAWKDSPDQDEIRKQALKTNDPELLQEAGSALWEPIMTNYKHRLQQLDKGELTSFIHILEERLYHIDRQDIHKYTDGSDDGFLYCRCFIVGMGREYYTMVDSNPSKATMDIEAELWGFSAYEVYEEKFDEEFERYSVHSIESCSNVKGWPTE
jgi:hypothetical protein